MRSIASTIAQADTVWNCPRLLGLMWTLLCLAFLVATNSATHASTATYKLVITEPGRVCACSTIVLEVRARLDTAMVATSFDLTASEDGRATIIAQELATGLSYVSTDHENPFVPKLPRPLHISPETEMLLSIDMPLNPGSPEDGLPPGDDVLIERLTIRVIGEGPLVVAITNPDAAETQSNPNGSVFTSVTVDPTGDHVSLPVGPSDIPGDVNADCLVNKNDLLLFEACASGPGIPAGAGCGGYDTNSDGDVDQTDFAVFQALLTGP
jgi:hypothetical protein